MKEFDIESFSSSHEAEEVYNPEIERKITFAYSLTPEQRKRILELSEEITNATNMKGK